jgi:hypothetical protein
MILTVESNCGNRNLPSCGFTHNQSGLAVDIRYQNEKRLITYTAPFGHKLTLKITIFGCFSFSFLPRSTRDAGTAAFTVEHGLFKPNKTARITIYEARK